MLCANLGVSNTVFLSVVYAWASAGISKGGTCPRKCCEVFCALAVTVKRSVDQLFMHYFHNFSSASHFLLGEEDLEGRSFGLCFEGDD